MLPHQIDALLERLIAQSHRYVSRNGWKGTEDYFINPDGPDAAALIRDLLVDRERLINRMEEVKQDCERLIARMDEVKEDRDDWRTTARIRAGEIALFHTAFEEAVRALKMAHYAIDATDEMLAEAETTREELMEEARAMMTFPRSPYMNVVLDERAVDQ